MDNDTVIGLFRKIEELASVEVGPRSEALESIAWDFAKEIREKAKEILGILKAPLETSDVVDVSSTGVSDCFVLIKNMVQQVLAESGDGTANSAAVTCRKIIAATRRLEELLKPSLSTGVVSGMDPDSAVVDPLVRAESDAFTQQTGASHPGCSEQTDRVEAESSSLDEIVSGGSTEANIQRLEHRLLELRSLHQEEGNHPDIATTLYFLGQLSLEGGDLHQAKQHLEESLRIYNSLPEYKNDPRVADALHSLGVVSQQAGDLKQAKEFFDKSLSMKRSLRGKTDHLSIGLTLRSLGELSQQAGNLKQAKEYFNESLTVTRSGTSDKDDHKVAEMLHSLGELSQQTGDLKEGIKFLQESLQMQRSLHGDRDHPGIAATLQKLGDLTAQNGDLKEGIKFLQESFKMQRSLHGDRAHPGIAATLQKLGDLTAQSGDPKQGIKFLQESLQMQRSLHSDRAHPGIAATLQKLGDLNSRSGDLKQAIKFLQESLRMQRSLHGERDHPGIATTLHKLGDLTAQFGDLKQGIEFFQESLRMQRSLHGDRDNLGIAITLHKLGDVAILTGDSKQGTEFLQESLQMQRSLHGDRNHAGVAITLRKLGDVMAQTGDVTQALRNLQESAEINRSLYGEKDHPNVADVLHSLGKANQRAGNFEQAEKFLEQSLRMKESLFADKKHPSLRLTSNLLDQVGTTVQIANKFKAIRDLASFKEEGQGALMRDAEAMLEATSEIGKIAQEILSKLQKPSSEPAKFEDKAQATVYDIFGQIFADAEDMTMPSVASNPDTPWAAYTCERIMFASQKAAEIPKRMIVIKGYFKTINTSALQLHELFEDECADTADANTAHEFDFHSFILSESSLIRQLAKKILKTHGVQPAADFETQNARPIYSQHEVTQEIFFGGSTEICMRIAGLAGFIVVGTHNDTFETACNNIIGETFAMEDLLLDFVWARKGVRKSDQDSIIHTFRKIREIALECESQVDEDGLYKETSDFDVDKVLLETISIRQLAQKILDQYRAPLGERLKELEDDKVSKVFGVIVDAAVEMVLLPGNDDADDADYLAACREIIHATHSIEGLVKPPGLSAPKMTVDDETASTASLPDTVESYQVGSSTSSSDTSVVRTDSIKVGLADDRSIFAEYVSGRPQDCVAKYLPWTPDGITYYHLWIQRTICLHHVTGTCVKKDTCKWLHPNYLDILEALNRLMRSAPVAAEPESAGKDWWHNGYGRGE